MTRNDATHDRGQHIGFFLVPGFAMMAFTSLVEPLRAANLLAGEPLYRWDLLTADGLPVRASTGIEVSVDARTGDGDSLDAVFLCTGGHAHVFDDRHVFAWLRRLARRGTQLGAVADGAFILAAAGLLNGYSATIHWQSKPSLIERFPNLTIVDELYVIDRDRYTCAGGTGAFDMMLDLIERDHGRSLAMRVAEWFVHERLRSDADRHRLLLRLLAGSVEAGLLAAIELMEKTLETPLNMPTVAVGCGVSLDWLERHFKQRFNCTPQDYYMDLRLRRAQRMLLTSTMPIYEVALACGFTSASHFARRYKRRFAETPRQTRQAQALVVNLRPDSRAYA